MDSMWMQSCRAFRWLDDSEEKEVELEAEVLLLVVPDVDIELIRLTVEDDESMYAAE